MQAARVPGSAWVEKEAIQRFVRFARVLAGIEEVTRGVRCEQSSSVRGEAKKHAIQVEIRSDRDSLACSNPDEELKRLFESRAEIPLWEGRKPRNARQDKESSIAIDPPAVPDWRMLRTNSA